MLSHRRSVILGRARAVTPAAREGYRARQRTLTERASAPIGRTHRRAPRQVSREVNFQAACQRLPLNGEIDFIVQTERSVVEIVRANDRPDLINDQDLCVHHRGLIFV